MLRGAEETRKKHEKARKDAVKLGKTVLQQAKLYEKWQQPSNQRPEMVKKRCCVVPGGLSVLRCVGRF